MVLGITVQTFGWRNGYLLVISLVITASMLPMGRIFYREMKEILEIRRRAQS